MCDPSIESNSVTYNKHHEHEIVNSITNLIEDEDDIPQISERNKDANNYN